MADKTTKTEVTPAAEIKAAELTVETTPATLPAEKTVPAVTASELLGESKETPTPQTDAADETTIDELLEGETVATITNEGQASQATTAEPTTATLTGGRGRGIINYTALDWTKSNTELAAECNCSRQNIQFYRKKKERGEPLPTGDGVHRSPRATKPDFSDVLPPVTEAAVDYALMSQTVFDLSVGAMTMIFGPEWQPKSQDERGAVCLTLKNYLTAKQAKDLPPGVILCFVCMAYAAPRLTEPNTSSKLKLMGGWLKMKVGSLFARFRRKKQQPQLRVLSDPKKEETNG